MALLVWAWVGTDPWGTLMRRRTGISTSLVAYTRLPLRKSERRLNIPERIRSGLGYAPMRCIVHHKCPTSDPFLLLPVRDFEGVGGGVTAFQTTMRDDNREGNEEERLVMTNKTARSRRLFRSRRVASLRLGLRKLRKVSLLVVIVGVERQPDSADQTRLEDGRALSGGRYSLSI